MKTSNGTCLAKVLWHYNLMPNTNEMKFKIVCPFHRDVNSSLLVDFETGRWFCFGCNLFGSARDFVEQMEKILHTDILRNELQIYQLYIKILNSGKCSNIVVNTNFFKEKKTDKQAYNEAYDYYHGLKKVDWKQCVDDECKEIILARQYMKTRGFNWKSLNECKMKVTYNNSYGIIFPMIDNKKFKGWVCRTMCKELEKKRKYLYNEGFSRATTLVGNYGGKYDYVFVVEGYMDRLKFVQNGVHNVVAILGWKMSQQQQQKLKDAGVKVIISALDNDECGRKGTLYLKNVFGPSNVVRFNYLKGFKDPGEMNSSNFKKMYNKTMLTYKTKFKN